MDEAAIFAAALERAAEVRDQYLDEACGADEALRARVARLLEAHEGADGFLEAPAPVEALHSLAAPGTQLGPYTLQEEIGSGGFGVVFVAEQKAPLRRRVAVKVIKAGMDTREVVARFETERQALALMEHPNIARVFDGGATPGGRPYFVMELVQGVPIHEYCDQCRLPLKDRLDLFVKVCRAVEHAHQKGVIHRDLKPSNILVAVRDGRAVPKVIDFGVAKAAGPRLTEETFHTRFAQMIGTPQYMSPEQAEMSALDVDTRSDIYALGVLLYELLTGTTPLTKERVKTATFDELRKLIREDSPPTPSVRLTALNGQGAEIAAARRVELRRLVRLVHGDLDWIVMRAIEKDRTRRYGTATALAEDVERYLADEPVEAGPPSVSYRLRKFVRRNRARISVAAFAAVLLLTAGWMVRERALQTEQLTKDVQAALDEATRLREATWAADGSLVQLQAGVHASRSALARAESLVSTMGGSAEEPQRTRIDALRSGLADDETDLRLLAEFGRVGGSLMTTGTPEDDDSAPFVETAGQRRLANAHFHELFKRYFGAAVGGDAEAFARLVRRKRPRVRDRVIATLNTWALGWRGAGDPDPDAAWLARALDAADDDAWRRDVRAAYARGDREQLETLADDEARRAPLSSSLLANTLSNLGAQEKAVHVLERHLTRQPGDFGINMLLGSHLAWLGRPAKSLPYFRAALALRPRNAHCYVALNYALFRMGAFERAETAIRGAIRLDPTLAEAWDNLGNCLKELQRLDEAVDAHKKAIELKPTLVTAYVNLGFVLKQRGDLVEAERALREAIRRHPTYVLAHRRLGDTLAAQRRFKDAEKAYREALELAPRDAMLRNQLGITLNNLRRPKEALVELEKSVELGPIVEAFANLASVRLDLRDADGALKAGLQAVKLDPDYAGGWQNLGVVYDARGQHDRAIEAYEKALELDKTRPEIYCNIAASHFYSRRFEKAIEACRAGIAAAPDAAFVPHAYNTIGLAYQSLGNLPEALKAYRKALDRIPNYPEANTHLGMLLTAQGRLDDAIVHLRRALKYSPNLPQPLNPLAWILATHPDPDRRRPKEAVELAERALQRFPQNGGIWNTLGVARVQAGMPKEAVEALEKSMALQKGGTAFDFFPLAVAHWQLGAKEKARTFFDRAVAWTAKHAREDEELSRFRKEAAEALGVKAK